MSLLSKGLLSPAAWLTAPNIQITSNAQRRIVPNRWNEQKGSHTASNGQHLASTLIFLLRTKASFTAQTPWMKWKNWIFLCYSDTIHIKTRCIDVFAPLKLLSGFVYCFSTKTRPKMQLATDSRWNPVEIPAKIGIFARLRGERESHGIFSWIPIVSHVTLTA